MQRFIMVSIFLQMLQNVHNKKWREGIFTLKERIKTIKGVSYGKQNKAGSFTMAFTSTFSYIVFIRNTRMFHVEDYVPSKEKKNATLR